MKKKYIIVGGVAGGASAASRLRRLDENAIITVFEKGQSVSFASCGLPYFVGGLIKSSDDLILRTPGGFKNKLNIDVRVNTEVVSVNRREKTVRVEDLVTGKKYTQKYDKLILATGASPVRPQITVSSDKVFSLRSIADTIAITEHIEKYNVRRAIIVGGGYIGLEIAENIAKRGINTFLVEVSEHVMPVFDYDMAQFAAMELQHNGVLLVTGSAIVSIGESEEGVCVNLENGRTLCADMVITGLGVTPEVTLAKKAGLGIGVTGGILVDERQQTTDKDIYAVGDAVEVECLSGGKALIPLASPADRQGRIAADNICGIASKYKKTLGVNIIKLFDSVLACAGLNEKQLIDRNENFEKVYIRSYSRASYYPGASVLTVKMMFDKKTGKILGVQIAGGAGVDKRIDVFATAMRAGLTAEKLADLELAYAPAFSTARDAVNIAGLIASDIMEGLTDAVQWHDIGRIDALLLDVRSRAKYDSATIEGAVNVPLEELRERIGELPKDRKIIAFSGSGQDGYAAERILKQQGFKAANLTGGYSLYEIFNRNKAGT